jgi:hypothetical protein
MTSLVPARRGHGTPGRGTYAGISEVMTAIVAKSLALGVARTGQRGRR